MVVHYQLCTSPLLPPAEPGSWQQLCSPQLAGGEEEERESCTQSPSLDLPNRPGPVLWPHRQCPWAHPEPTRPRCLQPLCLRKPQAGGPRARAGTRWGLEHTQYRLAEAALGRRHRAAVLLEARRACKHQLRSFFTSSQAHRCRHSSAAAQALCCAPRSPHSNARGGDGPSDTAHRTTPHHAPPHGDAGVHAPHRHPPRSLPAEAAHAPRLAEGLPTSLKAGPVALGAAAHAAKPQHPPAAPRSFQQAEELAAQPPPGSQRTSRALPLPMPPRRSHAGTERERQTQEREAGAEAGTWAGKMCAWSVPHSCPHGGGRAGAQWRPITARGKVCCSSCRMLSATARARLLWIFL